jgi:hypothetical protein
MMTGLISQEENTYAPEKFMKESYSYSIELKSSQL